MHQNLAEHLHTEECNVVIRALIACHKQPFYKKMFGICNDLDREVNRCTKKERLAKRAANKSPLHRNIDEDNKKYFS
ncbi:hypothetical protein ACJMK2_009272 [Sinanodonta woodiana]|uniref:COX assembly mitochondrial protein n=1 Tax=Sinanodonta woodiana TaxID=1069815 RepID=A0ABD3VBR7_SINWO